MEEILNIQPNVPLFPPFFNPLAPELLPVTESSPRVAMG
jgi:hypothetical protein